MLGPVSWPDQSQGRLRRLEIVVVEVRHCLGSAANDGLPGVGRQFVADKGSVCGGSKAVDPLVEYPVARSIRRVDVVIGFEIVHYNESRARKAPEQTTYRLVRIDRVHPPVVDLFRFERGGGLVGCSPP